MRVLILSDEAFEDSELQQPCERLKSAGVEFDIAARQRGPFHGKHGYEAYANLTLEEVHPDNYDLLLLPGGRAPAKLRKEQAAIDIARHFFAANKPIAAICHGPQILISSGLMAGRTATCYRTVAAELSDAGAHYLDQALVVDGNLITSRQPSDLDGFISEILQQLSRL